jgi:hypothetical protein
MTAVMSGVVTSVCRILVVSILKLEVDDEIENIRFSQNIGNRPRLYGVINQNTTSGISTFVFSISRNMFLSAVFMQSHT